MIEDRTYIYAEKRFAERCVAVYLVHHGPDGEAVEGQITWQPTQPPGARMQCATTLDDTAAQVLMDQLWDCGIRPTQGNGTAGALTATQKHLDDMRCIAMKAVDVMLTTSVVCRRAANEKPRKSSRAGTRDGFLPSELMASAIAQK